MRKERGRRRKKRQGERRDQEGWGHGRGRERQERGRGWQRRRRRRNSSEAAEGKGRVVDPTWARQKGAEAAIEARLGNRFLGTSTKTGRGKGRAGSRSDGRRARGSDDDGSMEANWVFLSMLRVPGGRDTNFFFLYQLMCWKRFLSCCLLCCWEDTLNTGGSAVTGRSCWGGCGWDDLHEWGKRFLAFSY